MRGREKKLFLYVFLSESGGEENIFSPAQNVSVNEHSDSEDCISSFPSRLSLFLTLFTDWLNFFQWEQADLPLP